jgi:hypothetical protein
MDGTHTKETNDAIASSLLAAGVGTAYHKRNLTMVNPSSLADWARGPARGETAEGIGRTLVGSDTAYDAAMILARGLHVQGIPSFITSLRRLVVWIEHDAPELSKIESARAFFVTGFQQTYDKGECPLKGYQIQDVEALLLERMDNNLCVFLHVDKPLGRDSWWSDNLVRRIGRVNQTVVIS